MIDEIFNLLINYLSTTRLRLHNKFFSTAQFSESSEGGARRGRRLSITLDSTQDAENLKPKVIIRTFEFWTLWLTFVLNTQAIVYINAMYKSYGQTFINDDHFLSMVGAIAAIFNASGRKVENSTLYYT